MSARRRLLAWWRRNDNDVVFFVAFAVGVFVLIASRFGLPE